MKKNAMFLFLILFSAALSAQAATEAELVEAAKKDPVLHLVTNGLSYGDVLQAEFKKKYPFIQVKRTRFPATGARFYFYGLFTAENPEFRADVVFRCQDRDILDWKESGWLADLSDLPNWSQREGALEDDKSYVYFIGAPHVLFYNPKFTKEADLPASLEELTEPKWRGKVALRSPLAGSSSAFLVQYVQGTRGNLKWYAQMAENRAFVGQTGYSVHARVQKGKIPLGLSRDVEVIAFATDYLNREKGKSSLKYKLLEKDLPYQYQLGMMNAHAAHPAAARLFFNYVLSAEARAHLEKAGFAVGERRAEQLKRPHIWQWKISESAHVPTYEAKLAKAFRLLRGHGATIEGEPKPASSVKKPQK